MFLSLFKKVDCIFMLRVMSFVWPADTALSPRFSLLEENVRSGEDDAMRDDCTRRHEYGLDRWKALTD